MRDTGRHGRIWLFCDLISGMVCVLGSSQSAGIVLVLERCPQGPTPKQEVLFGHLFFRSPLSFLRGAGRESKRETDTHTEALRPSGWMALSEKVVGLWDLGKGCFGQKEPLKVGRALGVCWDPGWKVVFKPALSPPQINHWKERPWIFSDSWFLLGAGLSFANKRTAVGVVEVTMGPDSFHIKVWKNLLGDKWGLLHSLLVNKAEGWPLNFFN